MDGEALMSDAFFNAFANTQNAINAPLDRRRRTEQEDRENAFRSQEMQMRQAQFKAQQQEAQREAAQRARAQQWQGVQSNFIGQQMYGARPASQPPMAGMTQMQPQQAPQGQMQPMGAPDGNQTIVDPATGREGTLATVTGMQRGPMPTQEEMMDGLMRQAWEGGFEDQFLELVQQRQARMSEEEKQGRAVIASAAGQILNLPPDQRGQAVMQALQQFGVDPADTKLDDYVNDPARLESALRFEMAMGNPAEAGKENIRVQGSRDEFRRPEIADLGGRRAVIGMSGQDAGQELASFRVSADPNAVLGAQTQRRGQDISSRDRQSALAVQQREGQRNRALRERLARQGMPQDQIDMAVAADNALSQMTNEQLLAIAGGGQ